MTTVQQTQIPHYLTGTWNIDTTHSEVSFTARHLMVSKVRGRFTGFSGRIVTAEDPTKSSVEATVDLATVNTSNADRDAHLRSADFLDVERYPTMSYRSTAVRWDGDDLVVDGELTLHGVSRPVPLALEVHGFQEHTPFGDSRVGFSASAEISRGDFGVDFNMPMDGGGVVVGDKIRIDLDIEAIRTDA
ncbi:MAG TPA: YceI family protein [Acidimicrobiia bacterium]